MRRWMLVSGGTLPGYDHQVSHMSVTPQISVVIPAFNAEKFLPMQLQALDEQTGAPAFEVIVVDNASTDATSRVVDQLAPGMSYPLRRVNANDHQGPGYARNVGAAHACAELLMFADADDVVSQWWVQNGARAFATSRLWSGGARYMSDDEMVGDLADVRAAAGDCEDWIPIEPGDLSNAFPVLMGGDFGVRRSVFLGLGGFDQSLGAVNEDNDFALRAHREGIPVDVAPAVRIAFRGKWSWPWRLKSAFRSAQAHVLLAERYRLADKSPFPNPWAEVVRVGGSGALMALRVKSADWGGLALRGAITAGQMQGTVKYALLKRMPPPQIGTGLEAARRPQGDGENPRGLQALSVIIPAKNAEEWIPEQLRALSQQVGAPDFEVVIGDNGSTDGTRAAAEAFPAPFDVRVVDATGVASASHARNVAADAASTDVLLFCDADDIVGQYWVRELYNAVKSGERVIARGVLEHGRFNSDVVRAAYRIDLADDVHLDTGGPRVTRVDGGFAGYLPTVPGNNFAMRRGEYLELGGMDPRYPGGSEETDFVRRAQEAGWRVIQAPGAVVHYRLRSTARAILRQQRNQQRGRMFLWTRYRDRGMAGPSIKASVLELCRQATRLPGAVADPGTQLAWAYTTGAHLGALEGMARYRWRLQRSPRPLHGVRGCAQ